MKVPEVEPVAMLVATSLVEPAAPVLPVAPPAPPAPVGPVTVEDAPVGPDAPPAPVGHVTVLPVAPFAPVGPVLPAPVGPAGPLTLPEIACSTSQRSESRPSERGRTPLCLTVRLKSVRP